MEKKKFEELGLSKEVLKGVEELGYEYATEIQEKAIPLILEGNDVIGRSHTGTGKTAAFGLPAIEAISLTEEKGVQVLILCPTRELAMQACEEIKKFSKYKKGVKPAPVYGGQSIDLQIGNLKRGANIVIGTPGRIMDHMRRKTIKFSNLKMVILDEADEMLNMGFREDIETILKEVPKERQTLLFSATMPPVIMNITKQFQQSPVLVETGDGKQRTMDTIEQLYYEVPKGRKMDAVNILLQTYEPGLTMIFCNTKAMVDEVVEYLNIKGFKAAGLHGDMKQMARTKVMESFKHRRIPVLVATDVAARGIDVDDIDAVINYDVPLDMDYYVHRIGRTGRAGKTGCAYTLTSSRQQYYLLRDIQNFTKAEIIKMPLPSPDKIMEKQQYKFEEEIKNVLETKNCDEYLNMVMELVYAGYNSDQVACALMHMVFGNKKRAVPVIQPEADSRDSGRRRSRGSLDGQGTSGKRVKLAINIGRKQKVAPNFIVGAMVEKTDMQGKLIGKIDIQEDLTTVEVPTEFCEIVLEKMQGCRIIGKKTNIWIYEDQGNQGNQGKRNDNRGSSRSGNGDRRRKKFDERNS